jgi:hypothetical protein
MSRVTERILSLALSLIKCPRKKMNKVTPSPPSPITFCSMHSHLAIVGGFLRLLRRRVWRGSGYELRFLPLQT